MLEQLSEDNFPHVVTAHLSAIAPELQRLDAAIAEAVGAGERRHLEMLRTMRIYLVSGLFSRQFYLDTYPDLRQPNLDPLEHFVRHGEREGRRPNPVFWPWHYRDDIVIPPPCEFEAAGREEQHAMMRVKRMLTARLGREAAFDCYRRMLGLPAGERIVPKSIAALGSVAAIGRGAFHEAAPAGEPFRIVRPFLIGDGDHHPPVGIARSSFVACLIDAQIRGRSAVIEQGQTAFLDFQDFEEAARVDQLDFDPAVFTASDGSAWIITPGEDDPILELDEAFTLIGPHTDGFGHWLWEYLPKYLAARRAHALPPVPLLVDADMPKVHREALDLMLPPDVAVIELPAFAPVRVRRLWCAPSPTYMPVLREPARAFRWQDLAAPPARQAEINAEMVRRAAPGSAAAADGDKLFLARRTFRHRRMFNADAIEAAAKARGFAVVDCEGLSFAAQIRLIRAARLIVVREGPALFLASFARPGAKLCILSHPDTAGLGVVTAPLAELGIEVTVLTGPYIRIGDEYRDGSVYQIDEALFCAFLAGWRAGAPFRTGPTRFSRRLARLAAGTRGPPRIAAFVGVKDEVEIVASMIDHHRAVGFDLIIACDVNSTDGTYEILERYRSNDDFWIMRINDPDYPEPNIPAALEMMKDAAIDWVVILDADEYCIPMTGNVKDCASLAQLDLLYVERFNVPLGPSGPMMPADLVPEHYGDLFFIAEPRAELTSAYDQTDAHIWEALSPKAMARPERIGAVYDGMHDIVAADRAPLRWARPPDLVIAHLPLTTFSRFQRKIENVRRFLNAHAALEDSYAEPTSAAHWRRWVALDDRGELQQEFEKSIFDAGTLAELRRKGVIRSAADILRERNKPDRATSTPAIPAPRDRDRVSHAQISAPAG